jgi:hypothetical protein
MGWRMGIRQLIRGVNTGQPDRTSSGKVDPPDTIGQQAGLMKLFARLSDFFSRLSSEIFDRIWAAPT